MYFEQIPVTLVWDKTSLEALRCYLPTSLVRQYRIRGIPVKKGPPTKKAPPP